MPSSFYMDIQLNNEREKNYILSLMQPLFKFSGFTKVPTCLRLSLNSAKPVLGRGVMNPYASTSRTKECDQQLLLRDQKISSNKLLRTQGMAVTIICKKRVLGRKKQLSAGDILQKFPWKFHHRNQLLDWNNMEVVAKQDFYELSPKLPLFSVLEGENDIPVVRYGISVNSYNSTLKFYQYLLGIHPTYIDDNFCSFDLGRKEGFYQEFIIKRSKQVNLYETINASFVCELSDTCSQTERNVFSCSEEGHDVMTSLMLPDPNGNMVQIIQKKSKEILTSCKQCNLNDDMLMEDEDYCSFCENDDWFDDTFSNTPDQENEISNTTFANDEDRAMKEENERDRTDSGFVERIDWQPCCPVTTRLKRTKC